MSRYLAPAVAALALAIPAVAGAAPATAHSPLVTITCKVDLPEYGGSATDVVITSHKTRYASDWMHGFRETATTLRGKVITRATDPATVPFHLAPGHSIGWIVGWQPHHIASCEAIILWGK